MFKNMTLGAKIAVGFAALILIALALGGLAVWNMNNVKTNPNPTRNPYSTVRSDSGRPRNASKP